MLILLGAGITPSEIAGKFRWVRLPSAPPSVSQQGFGPSRAALLLTTAMRGHMSLVTNVFRRGGSYYFRARILERLKGVLERREPWRSL